MNTRLHIGTFLGLAIAAWVVLLWIRGTSVTWDHFWPFGLVLSFLVIVVAFFERKWWSWRYWQEWFVFRPDIRGTWRARLETSRNGASAQEHSQVLCYMVVRQTLGTLNMRLLTPESSSRLDSHRIVRADDGVYHVAAVYVNEPRIERRGDTSEIHYGAMILQILGDPPRSLEGHYWTDRNSRGSIVLTERRPVYCACFDEARALFNTASD